MNALYILTAATLLLSFLFNRKKTGKALMVAAKKLWKITPPFLTVLMGISIILFLVPQEAISNLLGECGCT